MNFYNETPSHLPEIAVSQMSDEDVLTQMHSLREELGDQVVILGHHYQQDDVISLADYTGDSLQLARNAAELTAPYIIFCGVHFMAETADMLTKDNQSVILPDLNAGCSMADMANLKEVERCWSFLGECTNEKIIPITYINCSALLKGFVGRNEGSICTSSNAKKVIQWALNKGEKLLFFPDQHLGRNTCEELGISLEDMVVYNPNLRFGGLTSEQVAKAKVILWYGYCSVHQGFTADQVQKIKQESPETTVIVHPECPHEVVKASDLSGSTSFIINTISKAKEGSKFAVGTEINLVNRLAAQFPKLHITSLSPYQCLCTTMYRVRPRWLLRSLQSIKDQSPINIIKVDEETTKNSLKALERMLEIS